MHAKAASYESGGKEGSVDALAGSLEKAGLQTTYELGALETLGTLGKGTCFGMVLDVVCLDYVLCKQMLSEECRMRAVCVLRR